MESNCILNWVNFGRVAPIGITIRDWVYRSPGANANTDSNFLFSLTFHRYPSAHDCRWHGRHRRCFKYVVIYLAGRNSSLSLCAAAAADVFITLSIRFLLRFFASTHTSPPINHRHNDIFYRTRSELSRTKRIRYISFRFFAPAFLQIIFHYFQCKLIVLDVV